MKARNCVICGREFESHNGIEVCSEECKLERKHRYDNESNARRYQNISNSPKTYTCKNCGKTFTGLRQKYCSDQCRAMARKKHVAENNQIYRMKHKNSQSKEKKNED